MDVGVRTFGVVKIGPLEIWLTETLVNSWLIMLALILFALIVRFSVRSFKQIPSGFQSVIESLVELFERFFASNTGGRTTNLGSWFFMVFAFILFSNVSGVTGLRPPTADFAVTFAFAFATFVLIQATGLRHRKGEYVKSFFKPVFIFLPLNIISELARPISLSFRLFGNVLVGMILMSIIYELTPIFVRFILPVPLHIYFDVVIGILQTYIFTALSLSFISEALPAEKK